MKNVKNYLNKLVENLNYFNGRKIENYLNQVYGAGVTQGMILTTNPEDVTEEQYNALVDAQAALLETIPQEVFSKKFDFRVEVNGIANIYAILEMAKMEKKCPVVFDKEIREQLDIMERYMLAVADAGRTGKNPPMWHEVRENKDKFKNNRGQ